MQTITLGNRTAIPVVAQRHARLRHYLTKTDFGNLLSGNYGHESYRLLCILVPVLSEAMPEYEWEGFASQEAMAAGEYVEDLDRSPTTEEIVMAFEAVLAVNGAGRLGKLMDLLKMGMRAAADQERQTQTSPASPGTSGE